VLVGGERSMAVDLGEEAGDFWFIVGHCFRGDEGARRRA
jgi:hypothetical protein